MSVCDITQNSNYTPSFKQKDREFRTLLLF